MTLTRNDEAPQWAFWLAIVGVLSAPVTLVALVLCIPAAVWMLTPAKGETQ